METAGMRNTPATSRAGQNGAYALAARTEKEHHLNCTLIVGSAMRLVSLGSSFASGPGLKPYRNPQASRSKRNYPSIVAERLGADLVDLTSGGSTLLNITESAQGTLSPQIEGIPSDADIITITSGGNDMAYVGQIMLDSVAASWLTWPLALLLKRRVGNNNITESELLVRFRDVIAQIKRQAPKAMIILVEYLTLIGPDYRPGTDGPLDSQQAQAAQRRAAMLQRVYMEATKDQDRCSVLPVADVSLQHGVGSKEPWVTGHGWEIILGGSVPWHPSALGMEKVADLLHRHIDRLVTERG